MKRKSILISLMIIALVMTGTVALMLSSNTDSAKIIVATDTHYLSDRINDHGKAFTDMVNNSDGKMVQYSNEIMDAFANDAIAQKPDVVILSGDLTFNGERASHEDLIKKLDVIQKSGVQMLTIAGNHDIDVTNSVEFKGDEYLRTESVNAEEFKDMYYPFGMEQAESVDTHSLSYLYKVNKDLYVLMLDTNAYGRNFVQDESYEWIREQLELVKKHHAQVITVSHQNLFAHNEQLSFGYQLYDANELLALLNEYKVKCNLSGHIHMQHIKTDGITEIATSSLIVAPAQYGVIDFNGDITYSTRSINMTEIPSFSETATEFFKQSGRNRTLQQLKDSNIPDDEKKILADTFAELNASYFAGTELDTDDIEDGIKLWENKDEFMSRYISTMLAESENDYNHITIKN